MRLAASQQKKENDSEEEVMSVDNVYAANVAKLLS
jgi:hypothetical protein